MIAVPQPPAEQRGDVAALPSNIAGLIEITENGCWEWQGPRVGGRYGRARLDVGEGQAKNVLIHRYVWTLLRGPIPPGFYACHTCDNPPCCNPDHLFIGTQTDNMRDAASKGRLRSGNETLTHCPQGHPYAGQNLKVATYGGRHRWRRCRTCDNARRARFNSAVTSCPLCEKPSTRGTVRRHMRTAHQLDHLAAALTDGTPR